MLHVEKRANTYQAKSVKVAQCRLLTTQIGVFCCVSYKSTESWVATAYTMRYPNENAGFGPGVVALVSTVKGLDVDGDASGTAGAGGGGGSMTGTGDVGLDSGSGSDGMSSSADEVSIVMCSVSGALLRKV